MLGAAAATLLPARGGGGHTDGQSQKKIQEKHGEVKAGSRRLLPGVVRPLNFFLGGKIHLLLKAFESASFVSCSQMHPNRHTG